MDFGADTDAIRRWLAKRATYAGEMGDPVGGGKHREDPPGTVDPRSLSVPNARDAGKDVLEALVAPEPPIAKAWPQPYEASSPGAVEATTDAPQQDFKTPPPRPGSQPGRRSPYASTAAHEEELIANRSTNAVFKPIVLPRRLMSIFVGLTAAVTAGTAYLAYRERTTMMWGLLVLLAVITLIVWAVRATTTVTEMAVIRGQLELIRDGKFEIVDLASPYTPILVEGQAGQRGWKVLVERHDQPLLIIDKNLVDPFHFMAVLQRLRPELRSDAATTAR
ncbi:hypothetical protein [Nocardioides stalactiti]|uniref:hypothetical protein n=1 Tax=Nocardioides stalactiti TaxID=2755356 RepID=UPI001603FD6F|nr:hypothetical protein [Nocardioides stalactiti]